MSEQARADSTSVRWLAGPVAECEGGSTHAPMTVHIIVRCGCGAAYQSTDAGLALGMAKQHQERST